MRRWFLGLFGIEKWNGMWLVPDSLYRRAPHWWLVTWRLLCRPTGIPAYYRWRMSCLGKKHPSVREVWDWLRWKP